MVEFSRLITTRTGQELNAAMISGEGTVRFTKVCASDREYEFDELENLTEISSIVQTGAISKVTRTNKTGVKVESVFSNYDLKKGYYMRTLGLYATVICPDISGSEEPDSDISGTDISDSENPDPELSESEASDGKEPDSDFAEEVLYAVAVSVSGQCYMPPNNGITLSSAYINLIFAVGNSDNVSLNVDPGCFATVGDLRRIEKLFAEYQDELDKHSVSLRFLECQIEQHDADISDLQRRLALLELMYATDISRNPFTVTFGGLDGLVVEGIWNRPQKRIDF